MSGRLVGWFAVALLAVVCLLAWQRYERDVASLRPAAFNSLAAGQEARVLGRVQAGSLQRSGDGASFTLEDGKSVLPVVYRGPDADTLRDLKTVLVKGSRTGAGMAAAEVSIEPNYGYIVAAYGLVIGLLLGFAWAVGRAVGKLEKGLDEA